MEKIIILHNSRCGKSRDSLKILDEKGVDYEVVEYLKNIPNAKELKNIIKKLKIKPEALLRKGESIYKENFKDKKFSDDEWIEIMVKNPILIERPIIISGEKAVIGRPPEKVLEII